MAPLASKISRLVIPPVTACLPLPYIVGVSTVARQSPRLPVLLPPPLHILSLYACRRPRPPLIP